MENRNQYYHYKNTSNNLVEPTKGGAIVINFLIFFENSLPFSFNNKFVKVKIIQ